MIAIDDRRPAPPVPDRLNIARHVLFANGADDAKIALAALSASRAERWSYGRLRQVVLATAGGLREAGLEPGERLLMRLGNTPDFPVAFLGAIAAGIVPVPTSAALTKGEITRIAERLHPSAIVAGPGVALPEYDAPVLSPGTLAKARPVAGPADTGANDPAYIVFTSGTSAQPMGVVHAHRAIWARGRMFDGWYGLTTEDRMFHAGAFNWTFTLGTGLLDPWTKGAAALVLAPGTSLGLLPLLARRHEATILAGAPGVFRQLLKHPLPPLPRLRHALSAGEKLPESLRATWRTATGTEIHEAFGQSECSTFLSGSPSRPAPSGAIGYTQAGRAVAILGPEGPVERGEVGEIAVQISDPGLALGYLDAPLRMRGGWALTGDQGVMREDGAVEYLGRGDDMLNAGGFRVSPLEIEAAMELFPGLDEAAATDHRLDPETTVIALHYTATGPLSEDALRDHAEKYLARYKQPRLFVHAENLPRNANGKLLRKALGAANEGAS